MLQDLDKSLERLLQREGKINKNEIDISFEQPTGEWSARLSRPTLSLWCFDIRENVKLRSMDWDVPPKTQTERNIVRRALPARRMDITYLVSAWTRKIEDEHQLLWRALAALKKSPVLRASDCVGSMRDQTVDMPLQVGDISDRQLNLVDLWSVLDNQMHLGFTVIVTVELDLQIGLETPLTLESPVLRVREPSNDAAPSPLDTPPNYEIISQADEEVTLEALAKVLRELGFQIRPKNGNGSSKSE